MDTIIQKASKGNRTALTQLYEGSKQTVYFLCRSLLRNSAATIPATKWALKSAFQATARGDIQTEDAFMAYAVKQAAGYCKKEIVKNDPRAFKLPPKKDFRISHVNEHSIDPKAGSTENYINCLPAAQRFALVLRLVGNMPINQIARTVGLEVAHADLLKESEAENLGKIYRAIQAKGGHCTAPTNELMETAFVDAMNQIKIPDEIDKHISNYINTVATPAEKAANSNRKLIGIAATVVIVITVILITVFAGSNDSSTTGDEDGSSGTLTSTEIEQTDTDSEIDTEANDEGADNVENADKVGETEDDVVFTTLDTSLIYYADIEIRDYGTITVQLDQSSAPITAANFVSLAESGFYDGLTFHRIMEDFMMQGGDPNGDGTGGSDETIVGEFADNGYDNNLSHTRGAISMARSTDYDSASSQFFIVHEDSSFLDGQYAVFGYVTEGLDIVDAICEAAEPTDDNGSIAAEEQPVITSVTIRTETTE